MMTNEPDQHPKRLTFVLGGLVGGGAEKVASILIREWISRGWEITLITRLGRDHDFFTVPGSVKRIVLGGEGESANKITALFKNIPFVWKLRKAIIKADTPVVLSFLTKTNIHTLLATRGLGKRVVISERNDTTRQSWPWPWAQLRRRLYRYADVVTANSDIALNGMREYVPAEKLQRVPNPVEIPAKPASPEQSHMILNVARLIPHKAQRLILEAFSMLPAGVQEVWDMVFLGEGEEKENLLHAAEEMGVRHRLKMPGLVHNTDAYYRKAGLFILPSEYEGTPNALLEAMAHGLPCIVSDNLAETKNYIEHGVNGYYFYNKDVCDLLKKMILLIDNEEHRAEFGLISREKIKEKSLQSVIEIWNDHLIGRYKQKNKLSSI